MKVVAPKHIAMLLAVGFLASCNGVLDGGVPKHEKPIPRSLTKAMKAKGMTARSPILLRIFKEENVLEVWKQDHTKRYAKLADYEICKWSGKLGPKHREGDKQAPEGFYHVSRGLMNPNSSYHLSFNIGYPNSYDRAHGRTGSHLMVHGACSSAGCYSMTDEYVEEIYALAREAFKGGQRSFQVQAYPFRMTAENMAKHVGHKDFEFWKMLKEGNDHFEVTRQQPVINVCEKRYVFNRTAEDGERFSSRAECPATKMPRSLALAFNEKQNKDQEVFDRILKRNLTSPFVPEEKKPKVLTASIKATPTVGPLAILEPQPVVTEVAAEPSATETPKEAQVASAGSAPSAEEDTEAVATTDFNPISAEVGNGGGNNGQAPEQSAASPVIRQAVTQIAVPERASR